jgi:ubiquinone/menaquinone biosynthesis C-methylase UbiE
MPFDPEAVREFERAGWNRAAGAYEAAFATATRQFIEPLLDAAAIRSGAAVLDLCCGPGFVGAAALQRGARVTGLDFSQAMLAEARARFPAIIFNLGDAEAPPYQSEQFDAVVSNVGIHHVPRPLVALAAAHRILKPKGRLAFTIWAGHDRNTAWKLIFDAVRRFGDPSAAAGPPPGGGFASEADCVRALHEAGFVQAETRVVTGTWRHADATALLAAFRSATARMAAMLNAQSKEALAAIATGLTAASERYRDAGGIAVPIAGIVASGVRP